MTAWLFPGQGSQRPTTTEDLPRLGDLFESARRTSGLDLERVCRSDSEWPPELLQPAIFTISVAAAETLRRQDLLPTAVAGHSLGEFAALVAAEVLSLEDGVRLVAVRGKAMVAAGRRNPGGMAAVLGLPSDKVEAVCDGLNEVWVANYNTPEQTVVSGRDEALATAAEQCLSAGASKVVRLRVPMAAHTPLMAPAAQELGAAIEDAHFRPPSCSFFSGVDASSHHDPAEIAELLATAVTSPVRFAEMIAAMGAADIDHFVEVGPGRILRGLVKQNLPEASLAGVSSEEEAEALLSEIKGEVR